MSLPYHHTEFVMSALSPHELPPDQGAEVAFAGRSNAGKSSAINAVTGRKSLARTSKTPGRTQRINFFRIDEERHLVDLPGYGYAKVPLEMKKRWERSLEDYLRARQALRGLVMVMDVRHPLTEFDRRMLEWAAGTGLAVHVLLTKADKLKRGPAKSTLLQVRAALRAYGERTSAQLFSALTKDGVDEARAVLDAWLGVAPPAEE